MRFDNFIDLKIRNIKSESSAGKLLSIKLNLLDKSVDELDKEVDLAVQEEDINKLIRLTRLINKKMKL